MSHVIRRLPANPNRPHSKPEDDLQSPNVELRAANIKDYRECLSAENIKFHPRQVSLIRC